MCIYCGTNNYRKIFEHHYGPIPKDELGRSFHIHHKDGNHQNNNPDNLQALSIQQHYNIHAEQNDWAACLRLAPLLGMSSSDLSDLASKANKLRLAKGSHIFQQELFQKQLPVWSRARALKRVSNGTNPFLNREKAKEWAAQRVESGIYSTDEFKQKCSNNNKRRVQEGTNPFSKNLSNKYQRQCPHCNTVGSLGNMTRWHFDNCKDNPSYTPTSNTFTAVSCPFCDTICTTYQSAGYHFDKCKSAPGYKAKKRRKQQEITCPHCQITGASSGMKRWHFDKCHRLKDGDPSQQKDS